MVSKADGEGPTFLETLGGLFGGSKVVRPAFSAYGKLPLYKDFLRHGLASREAQALRQWLDRGMSRHWDADPVCSAHPIAPHAFSLAFEGLARRVVGCLWGSHDQGELRRFPFTLFVSLPAGGSLGDLAALDALVEVAPQAAALRRTVEAAPDVPAFNQRLRESSLTLRLEREKALHERWVKETADLSVRGFAESLYGEEAPRKWPALLAYLGRRRAAANGRHATAPPLACRLPVSPLLPAVRQAGLWAAVLRGPGAKSREPLNVLAPGPGADPAGGIVILERSLRPDDVLVFHPEPPGSDLLEDLRTAVPGPEPPPARGWDGPLSSLLDPGALAPAGG